MKRPTVDARRPRRLRRSVWRAPWAVRLTLTLTLTLTLSAPHAPPAWADPAAPEAQAPPSAADEARDLERLSRSKLLESNGDTIDVLWQRWFKLMNQYADKKSAQNELPDPSWWSWVGENKRSNLEELNELSAQILGSMRGTRAQKLRDSYRSLSEQINNSKIEARQLAEDSYLAPEEGEAWFYENSKDDYKRLIQLKQAAIKELEKERMARLEECHDALVGMGVQLTEAQVRDLFSMQRSGDSLLDLMVTYMQLNLMLELITEHLDPDSSKRDEYLYEHERYYAAYVAVIGLMIDIHAQTRLNIEAHGLSELVTLEERLKEQIKSTTRLLREESGRRGESGDGSAEIIQGYKDNLRVQTQTLEGVREYHKILARQVEEIRLAEQRMTRQFNLALNTYQTVSINKSYHDIVQRTSRELHNISALRLPQMIPIIPERLSSQLGEINSQIQESTKR